MKTDAQLHGGGGSERRSRSLKRVVRVRTWKVKRVVVEMYSVEATSRADALEAAAQKGDPYSVTIKSETATPENEEAL